MKKPVWRPKQALAPKRASNRPPAHFPAKRPFQPEPALRSIRPVSRAEAAPRAAFHAPAAAHANLEASASRSAARPAAPSPPSTPHNASPQPHDAARGRALMPTRAHPRRARPSGEGIQWRHSWMNQRPCFLASSMSCWMREACSSLRAASLRVRCAASASSTAPPKKVSSTWRSACSPARALDCAGA